MNHGNNSHQLGYNSYNCDRMWIGLAQGDLIFPSDLDTVPRTISAIDQGLWTDEMRLQEGSAQFRETREMVTVRS